MSNKELAEWTYNMIQRKKKQNKNALDEFLGDVYNRKMNNRRRSINNIRCTGRLGQP